MKLTSYGKDLIKATQYTIHLTDALNQMQLFVVIKNGSYTSPITNALTQPSIRIRVACNYNSKKDNYSYD